MGTFSIIILFSVSLLCLIAFIRISSIVPNNEPSAVHQQFDGEMPDSHRRLAESKSTVENPFMDGVCLDFIQDSMLQVTVNSVSVVVVARNEDRSALLRTVSQACPLWLKLCS